MAWPEAEPSGFVKALRMSPIEYLLDVHAVQNSIQPCISLFDVRTCV